MVITFKLINLLRPPLKIYWWRYDHPNKHNFGDELTPYIIKRLRGRRYVWAPPSKCDIAGAGSIIEILQQDSVGKHIKIWGSGFIKEGPANTADNFEFLAVRGKLSKKRIGVDVPLGDPGLLTSLVYRRSKHVNYKVGIVAHYVDAEHPVIRKVALDRNYKIINPLDPPAKVIKDITSCELILSSSLHGLIVADSFGVPNRWMPLSDRLTGGAYKFEDYYSAIDKTIHIFDKGSILNINEIESAIRTYRPVVNLSIIQKRLIESLRI